LERGRLAIIVFNLLHSVTILDFLLATLLGLLFNVILLFLALGLGSACLFGSSSLANSLLCKGPTSRLGSTFAAVLALAGAATTGSLTLLSTTVCLRLSKR
jgi:hypothetical protein